MKEGSKPVTPTLGLGVLHLFGKVVEGFDAEAMAEVVEKWDGSSGVDVNPNGAQIDTQIITVEILGHKADLGFMILDADFRRLREIQTELTACGVFRYFRERHIRAGPLQSAGCQLSLNFTQPPKVWI